MATFNVTFGYNIQRINYMHSIFAKQSGFILRNSLCIVLLLEEVELNHTFTCQPTEVEIVVLNSSSVQDKFHHF